MPSPTYPDLNAINIIGRSAFDIDEPNDDEGRESVLQHYGNLRTQHEQSQLQHSSPQAYVGIPFQPQTNVYQGYLNVHGAERLYANQNEIIDAVNQLFDKVFICGSAEYKEQLYSAQKSAPMLAQSMLSATHFPDFGWRFRTILQVMFRRTPGALRQIAGWVFDSCVQNYLHGASVHQDAITVDSLVARSKQPPVE